jgi:hypothetical protein
MKRLPSLVQKNLLQPSAVAALAVASKSAIQLDHAPSEGAFGVTFDVGADTRPPCRGTRFSPA